MGLEPTVADKISRELQRASVQSSVPGLTVGELAERLDVTPRTIHNHIEDALEKDGVYAREVGNAKLYWYDYDLRYILYGRPIGEDPSDDYWYLPWEQRGRWLGARRQLVEDASEGVSVRRRARWVGTLKNYAQSFAHAGRLDLQVLHYGEDELQDLESEFEDIPDRPTPAEMYAFMEQKRDIPRETAFFHFEEYPFFTVPDYGEVNGIAEFCTEYTTTVFGELREDDSIQIDWDEVDEEAIEGYLPTASELLTVGDAIDTMHADLFDVRF